MPRSMPEQQAHSSLLQQGSGADAQGDIGLGLAKMTAVSTAAQAALAQHDSLFCEQACVLILLLSDC